jgi:hypothetical protein
MGLCFTQETRPEGCVSSGDHARGTAPGETQGQVSDVTAFLGEIFKSSFFGNSPKMGQQRVLWLTPMAKGASLTENRAKKGGDYEGGLQLWNCLGGARRTTSSHLWGHRLDPDQIRSSCSTFLAWPGCASHRCTCVRWRYEAESCA